MSQTADIALQAASPVLEQQISQTIASNEALQPGTPIGDALVAYEQSQAQGASAEQTAVNVARAAGAAAGAVCGPGAPACAAAFGYTAGELTRHIFRVRSGDATWAAGRRSPNAEAAAEARCQALEEVYYPGVSEARAEYVKLFNRYITAEQVFQHMQQAAQQAGYNLHAALPFPCDIYNGSDEEWYAQLQYTVEAWHQAFLRTVAAYGHLAAQQEENRLREIYRKSIQGSVRRAAAAARGMAKSYGEAMRRNAELLKDAGYSYTERSHLLRQRGPALTEALAEAQSKLDAQRRLEQHEQRVSRRWWTIGQVAVGVVLLGAGGFLVAKAKS